MRRRMVRRGRRGPVFVAGPGVPPPPLRRRRMLGCLLPALLLVAGSIGVLAALL